MLGYFTAQNGPSSSAGSVYLGVLAWAGVTCVATAGGVRIFRLGSAPTLRGLAAAAAGLYYWFASAAIAARVGAAGPGTAAFTRCPGYTPGGGPGIGAI